MASTNIALNVRAHNKTGGVFGSIAKSARGIGAALAGVAGVAGVVASIKNLGKLSDTAMKASTSVHDLTQMSTALDVLGVKGSSVEELSAAFGRMTKATGEAGAQGFKKVVGEIAQIPTAQERATRAMEVFGRSGLNYMPLIEGAVKNGTAALDDMIAAMPGLSDAAASAGDSVADAMTIATAGVKSLWTDAIGSICEMLDGEFAGGVREAAAKCVAYVEYGAKSGLRHFETWVHNCVAGIAFLCVNWRESFFEIGRFLGSFFKSLGKLVWEWIKSTGGLFAEFGRQVWAMLKGEGFNLNKVLDAGEFGKALDQFKGEIKKNDLNLFPEGLFRETDVRDLEEKLAKKLEVASKVGVANGLAAVAVSGDATDDVQKAAKKAAHATGDARNDFLVGGTYAAMTAGIRQGMRQDDRMLDQSRKNGGLLDKIRGACEKTADALNGVAMLDY